MEPWPSRTPCIFKFEKVHLFFCDKVSVVGPGLKIAPGTRQLDDGASGAPLGERHRKG